MASVTQSSLIFRLNEDVLRYIFSLNANVPESYNTTLWWRKSDAPLTVTRCLDLELLEGGTNEWRNEVVRRTGNCLLTVIGPMPPIPRHNESMLEFLDLFMDTNWTRIRRLVVDEFLYDNWEELLKRPAPNLEQLCIENEDIDKLFYDINGGTLFSGTSPRSLRKVQICFRVTIDPFHPWYSNLRHFDDFCVDKFSASQLLHALQLLTHLETLEIRNNLSDYHVDQSLIPVNMPNLTSLIIESNIMTVIPLLRYIVTGPYHSFLFEDLDRNDHLSPEVVTSYMDIGGALSTFLRRQSYQHRTFPHFFYDEKSDIGQFYIGDGSGLFYIDLVVNAIIGSNDGDNWPDIASQFNAALLSGLAGSVLATTTLSLEMCRLPSHVDSMLAFFKQFRNVINLETDAKTLKIIREAEKTHQGGDLGSTILFPSVRLVKLSYQPIFNEIEIKELFLFVKARKDNALPLDKISICYPISKTMKEDTLWRDLASEYDIQVEFRP
ncbi:hypothetical protein JR316_0011974 [Psilocybe cubensis]|uniref:Uncharacterized protein n=2 Tax=Psilocybe cubensis TaxID=181762 RepID=A0ACB8GLR1_PSICU|nr:hypothetical protein JR316_0011974 [Psilocybe cubensis]KAH9476399.1 hypothetical protein JR316_0011974 [Psilocybe cubensis]